MCGFPSAVASTKISSTFPFSAPRDRRVLLSWSDAQITPKSPILKEVGNLATVYCPAAWGRPAVGGSRQVTQWINSMRVLLDESELIAGVDRLADRIDAHYSGRPLTVIAVMTGSLVLFADLIRRLSMPQRVGVVRASSYRGGMSSGTLSIDAEMMIDVSEREVLLVDDIFDTGRTLAKLTAMMQEMGAKSVKTAVLLHKQREHAVELRPDFVAFEIPDEFVVGYGLDYLDMHRNLPYLAVLEPAEIEATEMESQR